jgi:hypothetical protein
MFAAAHSCGVIDRFSNWWIFHHYISRAVNSFGQSVVRCPYNISQNYAIERTAIHDLLELIVTISGWTYSCYLFLYRQVLWRVPAEYIRLLQEVLHYCGWLPEGTANSQPATSSTRHTGEGRRFLCTVMIRAAVNHDTLLWNIRKLNQALRQRLLVLSQLLTEFTTKT